MPINTKLEVEKLANRGMGRSMSYLSTISEPLIQLITKDFLVFKENDFVSQYNRSQNLAKRTSITG